MKGHFVMSRKELRRKTVYERVKEGEMTIMEASQVLEQSYRQSLRQWQRFKEQGDAGLVHKSRGRRSNRAKPPELKKAVLASYAEQYEGFGPTLAAEKLAGEGLIVDHETLRRWLLADGQWQRYRRRKEHRQRRERKAHFGELVQLDGSHHHWFGEEHPQCCLMNMVDDATGRTVALMAEEETTEAAMRVLWEWIENYRVPNELYADRKNVYITQREATIEEQLSGEEPKTAFGLACGKLGIKIIPANSPQAKGRVERKHGLFQDRLVKELRLRGINTIEGANELLRNSFLDEMNEKFAKEPREKADLHSPVPKGVNLNEVFCFEEKRVLSHDWTIQYHNQCYQILEQNRPLPRPKDSITVRTLLDGTLKLLYRDKPLRFKLAPPQPQKATQPQYPKPAHRRTHYVPPPEHPWRRGLPLAAKSYR